MKRTPFYRRPGRSGQFSGLRERVIWMIQTRGRPVTGSEIAEKFGVTLIEFNRVANGITRGSGQIAQIVESEKMDQRGRHLRSDIRPGHEAKGHYTSGQIAAVHQARH